MSYSLQILGTSAAIAAHGRHLSAQVFTHRHIPYLIDCGEGTQFRLDELKIKKSKIQQIFISHLHGDHFFGLVGLITSYSLFSRQEPLTVFAPLGLAEILQVQFRIIGFEPTFPLSIVALDTEKSSLVFQNQYLSVRTIPLKHRIPTCGFLFEEKPQPRHIIAEKITELNIPYALIPSIKKGADFITSNGRIIANSDLTTDPETPKSFAYCSDTAYSEEIIPLIKGVDLLYHEATFLHEMAAHAEISGHSTALQAAQMAKKAEVGKLLIGHFSTRYLSLKPLLEEAQTMFPNTSLAEEGKIYLVE